MAYVPYMPETGAKYTLTGPDGSVAVFNDATDPNYVGMLTEVTGLDSALVRESADDLVQTDGGWHGDFWYGRRPITMSGTVFGHADANARSIRLDRARTASNALRADAVLSWLNTDIGAVAMRTYVRRQQPLRISGAWNKDFQLLLVSQFAPVFSDALYTQGNTNLISNPSFETNTTGWSPSTSARVNTGASLTRVTTQHQSGTASLQVITTNSATNEGADYGSLAVTAGTTYTISGYVKGNSGGEVVQMIVGDGTVGQVSTNLTATTSFQRMSVTFTANATGTTGVAFRTTAATIMTFFLDAVQVTIGPALQAYFDTTGNIVVENHGDYPSAPTVTITGASTNPLISNITTGAVFTFIGGYTIAGGHSVSVDVLNHIALLDGTTSNTGSLDFVNSSWPTIQRGLNTFSLSGGGSFMVSWRDNWS